MFLNDLYTVVESTASAGSVNTVIAINKSHKIFDGHFPGHPVLPGVCMMQIVREVLEQSTSLRLNITFGDNVKFLAIIDPEQNSQVTVGITYTEEENTYKVNAQLFHGMVTFFKFKGVLERK
ncbi:MAG TPA: hypothetical protein VD884_19935 [Ohtaekwangia sp.]|nr:hypothetical protein [Ohtaekwangia sp.]